MIVLLKIYAADKIFGKIGLKAIGDTFFFNMWPVVRGGTGEPNLLVGGDIQQKRKVQTFSLPGRPPPLIRSLSVTS